MLTLYIVLYHIKNVLYHAKIEYISKTSHSKDNPKSRIEFNRLELVYHFISFLFCYLLLLIDHLLVYFRFLFLNYLKHLP